MTAHSEQIGVVVVNFGEPADATPDRVERYLQRIFLQNVDLESHTADAALARAQQLAKDRTPGLVEDYRRIGGSPLNAQADAQAAALRRALVGEGWAVEVYSAFQFTPPDIEARIAEAKESGVERLVVLPLYPLCGQSTTVAALSRAREAARALGWSPRLQSISGWHDDADYVHLRVDGIREFIRTRELDLQDPETLLYFSVHGTPIKYLNEGNRYDRYVEEHTREIATRLGVPDRYAVGFQNHTNRRIEWTQPDNSDRMASVSERRLVVVPIAFMHEQSETLVELDRDLREHAEALGKEFYRVPVPYDDHRFVAFMAELVKRVVAGPGAPGDGLAPCRCDAVKGTWCTNGDRDLPASPYVPAVPRPA